MSKIPENKADQALMLVERLMAELLRIDAISPTNITNILGYPIDLMHDTGRNELWLLLDDMEERLSKLYRRSDDANGGT